MRDKHFFRQGTGSGTSWLNTAGKFIIGFDCFSIYDIIGIIIDIIGISVHHRFQCFSLLLVSLVSSLVYIIGISVHLRYQYLSYVSIFSIGINVYDDKCFLSCIAAAPLDAY